MLSKYSVTAFILFLYSSLSAQESIFKVVQTGDLSKLTEFLEKDSSQLNAKDEKGLTALHYACSKNIEMVKYLVGKGAQVNAKSNNGTTPLYTAVRFGKTDIAVFLLSNKADINAKSDGGSVMHQAVYRAPLELIVLLLLYHPDLSITDKQGQSVLHTAAIWNADSAFQLLMEAGANINLKDSSGNTPLHACLGFTDKNIDGSTRVVKLLIKNHALLSEKNNTGLTPLALAMKIGSEKNEIVRLLKEAGATE